MTDAPTTLRAQQFALARHIRDPAAHPPPPGIQERRLKIYRELFFNGIEGLLAGNFPILRRTLGDAPWHALVRRFYAVHRCRTPLFTEIAGEFVAWLEHTASAPQDPPWLAELAHYEWVELALQISECEADVPAASEPDDLSDRALRISPLAWPLAYRWPVHRIGPECRPDSEPATPTLLLVRRDPAGDIHFSELSPLAFRLLQLLGEDTVRNGSQLLGILAEEAGATDVDAFLAEGRAMLRHMHGEGVVLPA